MPRIRPPSQSAPFVGAALLVCLLGGCGQRGSRGADPSLPEEQWTYAMSHIIVQRESLPPLEARRIISEIHEELRKGRAFLEVAAERSRDPRKGTQGGFLGFVQPQEEKRFAGALMASPIGHLSGILEDEDGYHVFFRHSFAEGRELESAHTIPAYGFFVGWGRARQSGGRPREAAREKATEALRRLAGGDITIADAAVDYSDVPPRRRGGFIGPIRDTGQDRALYDALAEMEPGELKLLELEQAYAVVLRGHYFRSVVRHILVNHIESPGRPLHVSLTREEAKAKAEKALAELQGDPRNWDAVLRKYTDETGSIWDHGTLGSVSTGELAPDLEAVVAATEPGAIGARLAESPAGFHVLWRVN